MPFHRPLFRKIAIIGIGLIGGSLGLAIKKRKLAREVVGVSQRNSTLAAATKMGAVDQAYSDVKKALQNADCVILAAPVGVIKGMFSLIGPNLARNCIVTDVGSSKEEIVAAAQQHLPRGISFVGSHPLAGSEKHGVVNATDNLFENSNCILTPVEETNSRAKDKVRQLWSRLGAEVKTMSPHEHDRVLANISHLPHVLAYALMNSIPDEDLNFASTGLRDTTRIAASAPQLWTEICMTNPIHIEKALDEFVKNLSEIRRSLTLRDPKVMMDVFNTGMNKRSKMKDAKA